MYIREFTKKRAGQEEAGVWGLSTPSLGKEKEARALIERQRASCKVRGRKKGTLTGNQVTFGRDK